MFARTISSVDTNTSKGCAKTEECRWSWWGSLRERKGFDHGLVQFQKRAPAHANDSSYCNQETSKATQKEVLEAVVAKQSPPYSSFRLRVFVWLVNLKQPPPDPPYWTARFTALQSELGALTKCAQIHLLHATFSHVQSLHRRHSTDDMCTLAQVQVVRRKTSLHPRVMVRPLLHATLSTSSPSLSSASLVLLSSSSPNPDLLSTYPIIHCEDPRKDGTSTEYSSSTVYEPKRIELNRILIKPQNQIIDYQDDIEELGVKPLSCSQSLVHSAYDSAESIATTPDSDLEDEQLSKMLASPLYAREREENEGRARAYHSERESLMIHSSRNPEVSGKPDAECVQKREANAQQKQAYHSRRESLMASSSRDLEVSGKPDAMFSLPQKIGSEHVFRKRPK